MSMQYKHVSGLLGAGVISFIWSASAQASSVVGPIDLTTSAYGIIAVAVLAVAYLLVMTEEKLHMRKSKPVLVAAGIIWILIGIVYTRADMGGYADAAYKATLLEFAELLLFLLVAMTYINALDERRMFDALGTWLTRKGFSYRSLFWITGILAFIISPIADNLTTALLMCAVVVKVAGDSRRFVNLCCINIVVAANAGGVFSPFGDITTLMVWQAGIIDVAGFLYLFLPAIVNFVLPAAVMSFAIQNRKPSALYEEVELKRGARRILFLFLLTIATAVLCHSVLGLPPVLGMMMGLGYLQFFGYFLRRTLPASLARKRSVAELKGDKRALRKLGGIVPFDVFNRVARAEWDTLLFFYGVVVCIGGLGFMGYLALLSDTLYTGWSAASVNIFLGVLSAVIDNIPIMFAVLTMSPDMSMGNWLLITLTAGVGGSLLSIGSAAGVALMGQARGMYTFMGHLKWAPVIALGYIGAIVVHLWVNAGLFQLPV